MNEIIVLMKDEIEKELMSLEKFEKGSEERAKAERLVCDTAKTYLDLVQEQNRTVETDEKLNFEREKLEFEKLKLEVEREKFDFEKDVKNEELAQAEIQASAEAARNEKLDKNHLKLDIAKIGVPAALLLIGYGFGYILELKGRIPTFGPFKEINKKMFSFMIK